MTRAERRAYLAPVPPPAPARDVALAFQPVVSIRRRQVVAHEALARGAAGESAASVLAQLPGGSCHRFDGACCARAMAQAQRLGFPGALLVNIMPNALLRDPGVLRHALDTAAEDGFPLNRLILEMTEQERIADLAALLAVFRTFRALGVRTAIDDFGAGYAGLQLLARLQPDVVKLDMDLIRGIDQDRARQIIVAGILDMCNRFGIILIAEGVETAAERDYLDGAGIDLMQGYLFSRPAFMILPPLAPDAFA